jgi:hypothetical protein
MEHELTELDMRATILVDPVDPQPGYARFLEECPIREIGGGAVELYRMADILVVNKSDRPGAQESVRDLRTMLAMGQWADGQWKPPIVSTVASAGTGTTDNRGKRTSSQFRARKSSCLT